MSYLEIEQLTVNYVDKKVLKNCSFSQKAGEVIVVLGSSGDGKTTLLKAIAGFVIRQNGRIRFNGELVRDPSEQLVPGHSQIKLVNQDFNLDDFHTVEENIRLRLLAYDDHYRNQRIAELLRLTGLSSYRKKPANQLSGGQRQRLAIARALADEPELILLDEPFNQLDFETKNKIARHIKSYLKKYTIGAIMVTHNGLEAMEWADRILLLEKGRITREDSPADFYNHPRNLREARFFGEVNQVVLNNEKIAFRPTFYALSRDEDHSIQLEVKFKYVVNLGWYSAYTFVCLGKSIQLYATTDISFIQTIFIRKISITD